MCVTKYNTCANRTQNQMRVRHSEPLMASAHVGWKAKLDIFARRKSPVTRINQTGLDTARHLISATT
jgi:hypothetical protein